MTLILVITSILFLVNIAMNLWILPISTILSIILLRVLIKETNIEILVGIVLFLIVSVSFIVSAQRIMEFSFDGNTYHKGAVGLMMEGWNPVKESSADFRTSGNSHAFWIDHYAKGTWMISSAISILTNDIESGKAFNLLIGYSLFVITNYYFGINGFKRWQSIIIAILMTFNPVYVAQMFTYYNDGFLAACLFIVIIGLFELINKSKYGNNKMIIQIIIISCGIILCGNAKTSGLVYSAFFCIIMYLYYFLQNYQTNLGNCIKVFLLFSATAVIAILVVGYSTYIKNIIENGNPFFPLLGKDNIKIILANQPADFVDKSIFYKLFYSIFSKADNIYAASGLKPQLKIPFTLHESEFSLVLATTDLRISGFGVFFSGIFTISTIIIPILAKNLWKQYRPILKIYSVLLGGVIFLTIILSESWWARYAPFFYLISILAVILLFLKFNSNITTYIKRMSVLSCSMTLSFLMMVNVFFFLQAQIPAITQSLKIKVQLDELERINDQIDSVDVHIYLMQGCYYNFYNKGYPVNYFYHDNAIVLDEDNKMETLIWTNAYYNVKYYR